MEIWKTILLGVVEGVTEFLPISSTGHMILVEHWVEFPKELGKTFDVFIQLGAILAVVLYFRRRISTWLSTFHLSRATSHPITLVLLAFLPAAVVGLATHKWIQLHLFHPRSVATALIIGGIVMEIVERTRKVQRTSSIEEMSLTQAIQIGLFQCFSLLPGVSRSGATIVGALLAGLTLPAAAEFSFFLAIPTIFAASGYSLVKVYSTLSPADLGQLSLGFLVAFVTALPVVATFIRYIQSNSFRPFVVYRIVLGLVVLAVVNG